MYYCSSPRRCVAPSVRTQCSGHGLGLIDLVGSSAYPCSDSSPDGGAMLDCAEWGMEKKEKSLFLLLSVLVLVCSPALWCVALSFFSHHT